MNPFKKILLLSDLNSVHTQKWARSLAEHGFSIHVVGLVPLMNSSAYYEHPLIKIHSLCLGSHSKLKFFMGIPKLFQLLSDLKPDLVHAHFATSYGLLGSFSKKKVPLFLTLWGDDVLIFPFKSWLHKKILEFNLSKADRLYSSSQIMSTVVAQFTTKKVMIIPFGVDVKKFTPTERGPSEHVIIGTVKALEDIYGVDYLIQAFSEFKKRTKLPTKLLIVGEGSKEIELKQLAKDLGLTDLDVEFKGRVDHSQIPRILNEMDIFVALSRSESFGVAVVEAQACGKPVVVSDVGGLPEVVIDQQTGFVVPAGDIAKAAEALGILVQDPERLLLMGKNGRQRALNNFDWNKNVETMINEYNAVLLS